MSKTKAAKSAARRDFLKIAGLSAVAGVAVASAGSRRVEASPSLKTGGAGYQETEHVKKAYELSRF
jgi:FtsP/CotA-like multicopper oxidase with cupredoxin domain